MLFFFADDDIPRKGSLNSIISCLKERSPDVLRFSFAQPRESTTPTFSQRESCDVLDLPTQIDLLFRFPKVSTYAIRKSQLNVSQQDYLSRINGVGYMFIALSLVALDSSSHPSTAIIPEILAEADEDFDMLDWTPEPVMNLHLVSDFALVKRFTPDLPRALQINGYVACIGFCWAACLGKLRVREREKYRRFAISIPWHLKALTKNPRAFLQFFLLKQNIFWTIHRRLNITQDRT